MNLEARLKSLEDRTPGAYKTFDAARRIVIESPLPAIRWFESATAVIRRGGPEAEPLRAQLERSTGADGDKGRLYEVVRAMALGPVETPIADTARTTTEE